MIRRTSAYTGSAISVLTSTVMRICWSSSRLTGASTPSRNWISAIPSPANGGRRRSQRQRDEAVGRVAELAQAPRPVADRDVQQRRHAERLDEQPCRRTARSRSRMIAPGSEPASRPDRHHDQRRDVGADAEDRDLRDRRLLEITTASASSASRSRSRTGRRQLDAHGTCARCGCRRAGWSGSERRRGGAGRAAGVTWTCWLLISVFWFAFDTCRSGSPAGYSELRSLPGL